MPVILIQGTKAKGELQSFRVSGGSLEFRFWGNFKETLR